MVAIVKLRFVAHTRTHANTLARIKILLSILPGFFSLFQLKPHKIILKQNMGRSLNLKRGNPFIT